MDPEARSILETRAQIIQNKVMSFCLQQASKHRDETVVTEKEFVLDCFEKMRKTVRIVAEIYPEK